MLVLLMCIACRPSVEPNTQQGDRIFRLEGEATATHGEIKKRNKDLARSKE